MNIGVIINPNKPLAQEIITKVVEFMNKKGHKIVVFPEISGLKSSSPEEIVNSSEIILAMGGDGTLLKTARIVSNKGIPILGINLGALGFLTEVALDNLYPALENILKGNFSIEKRMVLEANIPHKKKLYGLNDIVIQGTGSGRMLSFSIFINKEYVSDFSADGLIVSTPTGSTAYSLAASGPVLYPSMEAIIINPICPHTLGFRPMVVSGDTEIGIEFQSEEAIVTADGQEKIAIKKGMNITIKKADFSINLIKSGVRSFYEILRTKLKWGGGKER